MPDPSIGVPFIELQQVDSTNNYAMALLRARMAHHGTAVFAGLQTAGRGQRARAWLAPAGENILLSVVISPGVLRLSDQFGLSMGVALAVQRFFNKYAGDETRIKWPNDLYWRDRKAGGILIENRVQEGAWTHSVAGMGININQTDFSGLGRRAVSLRQITGQTYYPVALARELCTFLEESYGQLQADAGAVVRSYQEVLYRCGESVRLRKDGRLFEAELRGVAPDGRLIVAHALEERFAVGEIELVVE
ncbi:MAG TPA: biotin--[acetyl-CoA-carboxylase] ligase [Chitinophagaceae bacterium]|nr:biotin--[acetyl-CoA-carboxylase] ligase [Chitinophagaceae bacterium]